ncbi:MAG: efflux RND transporter periplasmic adaptor subunit [Gammaproteobacteria bacterium]
MSVPFALATCTALAAPSTAVTTQTVQMQKLADTVIAYGQLVPAPGSIEWLSAARTGRISAVLVTQGGRVNKGQSLVQIETTPQTQATYQSAKSALSSARTKLEQTQSLEKNGLATRSDLATVQDAFDSAKARLAALEAEGVGSHVQTLKASAAGVVTQLAVSRGEWVSVGARIAALAPVGALWVRLGLTPEQAAAVKPQARVSLSPVFGAGKPLVSHVVRVAAQADSKTGLIDAEVPLPASQAGPFAGEWVRGTITLHSDELPTVARSAVLHDARGFYVFVVRHGTAHRVSVKPLIRTHGLVGLNGIEPGDVVVTQGNFELSDGAAVRVTKAKDSGS